jgi:hypothetical protein
VGILVNSQQSHRPSLRRAHGSEAALNASPNASHNE